MYELQIKLLRFFTSTTGLWPIAAFMVAEGNTVCYRGQYSMVTEHMPESHQQYLEWNGDRFRKWAGRIGSSTCR